MSLVDWLWLAVALLLSLALRIPFFAIPMLHDEGGYAYATRGWVHGTGNLYEDLWISRPQGIFFVYAGIFDLFGTGTVAFRFAAWIAIALTTVAIWGFTRLRWSPGAATLSALLFAVMSSLPNLEGYSANAEMFMGFPVALAMLWLLHTCRSGWPQWQLLGIGLLIGCAISLKPSAATMAPVALLFIVLVTDPAGLRARLVRCGWLLAGITIIGIASLIHGWYLGWTDFIYATITYRLSAQSAATVGLDHNLSAIVNLVWNVRLLIALIVLLLVLRHRTRLLELARAMRRLPARAAYRAANDQPNNVTVVAPFRWKAIDDGRFLLNLWLIGSLLGTSIGGDWWSHYLIPVVAPLSIWLGTTLAAVWVTLTRWPRVALAVAALALLLQPFYIIAYGSPERIGDALHEHPGYPAQAEVAAWLREHVEPGTTIYVAFDQASIYYLANLPPAYRHLYDQELRGIPSSYSDLIAIIRSADRPKYIVSTRQPGPFADDSRAFWQEVGQYYEVVVTIDGVPIYQDKATIEASG